VGLADPSAAAGRPAPHQRRCRQRPGGVINAVEGGALSDLAWPAPRWAALGEG